MSFHLIKELQLENALNYTLWGKLILFLNCFLQLNHTNYLLLLVTTLEKLPEPGEQTLVGQFM